MNTMIDRLHQRANPDRKSRKGRRALTWFLIGLVVKLAITAIAFVLFADGAEAFERNVIPISKSL